MSDLIDRKALMMEFATFVRASNNSDFAPVPNWNDAVSLVGSMPSAQPDYDLSGYSDKLWRTAYERGKAEAEPRWIPVSEKPRKNGEYLVTKIDHITNDRIVDIAHYANFIHDNNGFYKADEVIAWMPLPELYRKETEDETN